MRAPLLVGSVLTLIVAVASCGAPPKASTLGRRSSGGDAGITIGSGKCTPFSDSREEKPAGTPSDPNDEDSSGRRKNPLKKGDLCGVADSNLARAAAAILKEPGGRLAPHAAWDRKKAPERMEKVAQRLSLTKAEKELLAKNGFAVLSRNAETTYAWALHEVYQSELPIYVSVDAILHAVYSSNDQLIADIERALHAPLGRALSAMHCALADATAAAAYPPEVARDLDLYLTVARSLLADEAIPSVLGTDAEAKKLVDAAKKASGIDEGLEIFGRVRVVDWSQYEPRGHYRDKKDDDESPRSGRSLEPWFRAAMWLSRMELNVVSRSSRSSLLGAPDPQETPREAIDALALSDLVERAHVEADVDRLDRAWALLAGRREDVSVGDLSKLRKKAGIAKIDLAAFDKLKAAVGNDFQRTARMHPMPEGSKVLPAITTLLGPRVVADTAAFRPLLHSEVSERYLVGAGDVAYVLGLDRGKTYLKDEIAAHPGLEPQLDVARKTFREASAKDAGDLYGAWLGALRGVATKPSGVLPSFMQTAAYDDLRMNTLVAGYGQIRHNYVLIAGQSYDEGGCEIPDGWVEPLPAVYDGIAAYAARGGKAMKEIDPNDAMKGAAYFAELEKIARVLATIARHEVEGRALTTDEKNWLSMVIEMLPGGTGGPPTYTGWYFDLFRGRWEEALAPASFVADYHTSSWTKKVAYAGATSPRMGVFVVDAGGAPRVAVGPVARAYELVGPLEKRYSDATVVEAPGKRDPWAASYTAPAPPEQAIAAFASFPNDGGEPAKKPMMRIVLRSKIARPEIVIEFLDHHRVRVASRTHAMPANARTEIRMPPPRGAEGIRIKIGDWAAEGFTGGPSSTVVIERGGMKLEPKDYDE